MRLLEYNNDGESANHDLSATIFPYAYFRTHGEWRRSLQRLDGWYGKKKIGYNKIQFCGEQARRDGLQYFWWTLVASTIE